MSEGNKSKRSTFNLFDLTKNYHYSVFLPILNNSICYQKEKRFNNLNYFIDAFEDCRRSFYNTPIQLMFSVNFEDSNIDYPEGLSFIEIGDWLEILILKNSFLKSNHTFYIRQDFRGGEES
jgi:hypothetical protein